MVKGVVDIEICDNGYVLRYDEQKEYAHSTFHVKIFTDLRSLLLVLPDILEKKEPKVFIPTGHVPFPDPRIP